MLGCFSVLSSGRSSAATVDHTDIRGSGPHDWEPSGAASRVADERDRARTTPYRRSVEAGDFSTAALELRDATAARL